MRRVDGIKVPIAHPAKRDMEGFREACSRIEHIAVTDPIRHARLVDQFITEYGVADPTE